MRLSKHHGLGNVFLITFATTVPHDAPAQAFDLCDRFTGIGADGLIWLTPNDGEADITMTLLNADGSLAEISGNGLRCVAQALVQRDGQQTGSYVVASGAGFRNVVVEATDERSVALVTADMGQVIDESFPEAEARLGSLIAASHVGSASIGNPHVVASVASPQTVELAVVGSTVEQAVDGGANVEFIATRGDSTTLDQSAIDLTVWERGAGITQACGSGACVAATLAYNWGMVSEPRVDVHMPGGMATVIVGENTRLIGPATYIADIEVPRG